MIKNFFQNFPFFADLLKISKAEDVNGHLMKQGAKIMEKLSNDIL